MRFGYNKERRKRDDSRLILETIQDKFSIFLRLLDNNSVVLEIMSDMEEKSQGEYLFDINYIDGCLDKIRSGVKEIIEGIIKLGGNDYLILRDKYSEIDEVIKTVLPGNQPIMDDDFTVSFDNLNRTRALSVGSKNAQLGEMKARLGLPIPEGFAITARAYKHFVEANDLQARITRRLESVDIKSYQMLKKISGEICDIIFHSEVPHDLSEQIMKSYQELVQRSGTTSFSMRSSAIGEDTLFSFAGQYASYLNVSADELINRYREVLSSKFTPQAIYYFLSHALSEAELGMSVGCVSMIDAVAGGVVYSRDPVHPEDDVVLVNSIFGLGKYLVNGILTPDVFRVSRNNPEIIRETISDKPVRLVMNPDGGTSEEAVPDDQRKKASLSKELIGQLVKYAIILEKHYHGPQDMEWAVNKEGKLFLLQSRPLHVIKTRDEIPLPDLSEYKTLYSGGTMVCPGAGCGRVYHVTSRKDLPNVPEGSILMAPNPFPGLVTVMTKISALVTRVGGLASHMATIAREYHVPTLVGVNAIDDFQDGQIVTVDTTGGVIYEGEIPELVSARQPESELFDTPGIYQVLNRVLDLVSPLRLMYPSDDDFIPENCTTFHDITRYAHQRSMEEMFLIAQDMEQKASIGCRLKSDLPVDLNVIYIDRDISWRKNQKYITEAELEMSPMKSFWDGIKKEGWPGSPPLLANPQRAMGTNMMKKAEESFSESSFAILGQEYMMLSLRMGYHFTTIEAMSTDETSKNYIQLQYKDGGASLDRRIRRINLLTDILSRLGFVNQRKGDFLNAIVSYQDMESVSDKLFLLGRLIIMTKQLDMALSNDAIAKWYTDDFLKKLGLEEAEKKGGATDV